MNISYAKTESTWKNIENILYQIIKDNNFTKIAEIGGGAHPLFDELEDNLDFNVIDISSVEMNKAPSKYNKIVADICSSTLTIDSKFDLVFTKMLAEHIKNPVQMHLNIFNLLKKGGIAVHFFPTLFAIPFVFNKYISNYTSRYLVKKMTTRNLNYKPKFPAYYKWCFGPLKSLSRRYEMLGFEVIQYIGLFGHEQYYHFLPILRRIDNNISNILIKHPCPYLTSFAILVLRKS
ncbi:MAG: hypothetical protein APR63_14530 [Desulfuromonas sp. SDB]|nr:MAG: hypothetical protein APR63_14530 [Desulfuromonas sp. SDB]